jgi:hypothetical protein
VTVPGCAAEASLSAPADDAADSEAGKSEEVFADASPLPPFVFPHPASAMARIEAAAADEISCFFITLSSIKSLEFRSSPFLLESLSVYPFDTNPYGLFLYYFAISFLRTALSHLCSVFI